MDKVAVRSANDAEVITDYDFDDLGRLDIQTDTDQAGNVLASYDYTVRPDGKRTGLVENFWFDENGDDAQQSTELKSTSYAWKYDDVGRLTDEAIAHFDSNTSQAEKFEYDLTGNRTKLQKDTDYTPATTDPALVFSPTYDTTTFDPDEVFTYDYDANDRLTFEYLNNDGVAGTDQTTTYAYDQTQQIDKTVTAGAVTLSRQVFGYNLQGRMSSVINDTFDGSGDLTARQRTRYEYDSKSYRVQLVTENDTVTNGAATDTWTPDSSVEFLADHRNHTGYTQTIRETTFENGNTLITDYTFGSDEIAQRKHGVDKDGNPVDVTLIFGHDGHGSVRVLYDLSDTTAKIAQAFTFSAYGTMIALHNAVAQSIATTGRLSSLGYSGETFDAATQQQYLRARFYNSANGRFNRLDPFAGNTQDPQSLNKYAYVHGDPIGNTDPSGNISLGSTIAAIGIGLGNVSMELVAGGNTLAIIETGGKAGLNARTAGLILIANGEFELGFELYKIGSRVTKFAFDTIDRVDTALGLALLGVGVTRLGIKLANAAPGIAQSLLSFSPSSFQRIRNSAIETGEFLSSTALQSWDQLQKFVVQGVGDINAWNQAKANLRTVFSRIKLVGGGGQFRVATQNIDEVRQLIADLTLATNREVGLLVMNDGTTIIRLGKTADRVLLSGGVANIIAHSHPSGHLVVSTADMAAFAKRGQTESFLVGPAGDLVKWTSDSAEWVTDIVGQMVNRI